MQHVCRGVAQLHRTVGDFSACAVAKESYRAGRAKLPSATAAHASESALLPLAVHYQSISASLSYYTPKDDHKLTLMLQASNTSAG